MAESPSVLSPAHKRAVVDLVRLSPVADELGQRFAAAGFALHLVGGSVRDALLDRLGTDLDFCTDARPDDVLALAEGWAEATWTTGIAFGTVGLARRGLRLEITTFRAESYDPASRNPSVDFGDSLDGDLSRRDFTVNAMAVSLPDHSFADPFGGVRDLVARVLRTPGTPEQSFSDDPLRMLRAARFSAQLGFDVEPGVVAAMSSMRDRLAIVSVERVRDELTKLVLGAEPTRGLHLLVDTGLAEHVLPELPAMRLHQDPVHRHKDVYAHSLAVLERAVAIEGDEPDLVLRLAALLHDIGKPATRRFAEGGGVSFHHHEVVGARMTRERLAALRYPKAIVDDVTTLVELHLRFHGYGEGEWTDSAVRRYAHDAGPLLARLNKLVRSDCTTRNKRKAESLARACDHLEARITDVAARDGVAAVRPEIDGTQIMALLGLPPGPLVGKAWRHLKELRLDHGPLGEDAAHAALLEWAAQEGLEVPPGAASSVLPIPGETRP